ncbi:hypothetical protein [Rhodoferax antarcticus]|uniref:hypothetical protein n=1 Tax=Rhodoferax antarcticus TaxID=81479 RepID=UPI001FD3B0B0|nr:hypothetical protein [Rhodoferax antarcticus]
MRIRYFEIALFYTMCKIGKFQNSERSLMEVEFAEDSLDQLEIDARFTGGFAAAAVSAFRKAQRQAQPPVFDAAE